MKILLIYPAYRKTVEGGIPRFFHSIRGKYPPLGLAWIASSLEEDGHKVCIIDAEAEDLTLEQVGKRTKNFSPNLVGITCTTWTFKNAREVATHIKEICPDTPIIVGGPHLARFPRLTLEFNEFDYGVVGEGEITIRELVSAIQNGKNLDDVAGVVYKDHGRVVYTGQRELIQDLDELPFPAWHLLPIVKYRDILARRKNYVTMMTSRGCPFNCIFCDSTGRLGRRFRARSPKNIVDEMWMLYEEYKVREICFYDDTFSVDRKRINTLCDEIIARGLDEDLSWECRTRVDCVDRQLLHKMASAGCRRIRYGVESGNDEILKVLRKDITKNEARAAIKDTKSAGIEVLAYFMIGSPNENEETMQETIDFAIELDTDYALFNRTSLLPPGSDLFRWAVNKGYIAKNYWERYVLGEDIPSHPPLKTEHLSKATVDGYLQKAYRRFYLRPKYLARRIINIRSWPDLRVQAQVFLNLILKRTSP